MEPQTEKTSTSVFGDGRISTHADPTRGQRAGRIGKHTGHAHCPPRKRRKERDGGSKMNESVIVKAIQRPARVLRLPQGVPIVLSLINTLFDSSDFGLVGELLGEQSFPKMCYSLPWTPMNHRAKFDAASFIFGGEIHKRTDTHTEKKQTVTNISTPCLSACVDNNENKTKNRNPSEHKIRQEPYSAEPILRPEWSIWWEQKDL